MLRAILSEKNISLYQLEKISRISHSTLSDIYNERCNIDNCSISTINKIAESLNIDLNTLYKSLTYQDLSSIEYDDEFDLFKSNILQRLKSSNEIAFINKLESENEIYSYFDNKDYSKSLYLLSLIDYLSRKNNIEINHKYDELRNYKLNKLYVSKSIYLLLLTKVNKLSEIIKNSNDIFLSHNILEAEIENVI